MDYKNFHLACPNLRWSNICQTGSKTIPFLFRQCLLTIRAHILSTIRIKTMLLRNWYTYGSILSNSSHVIAVLSTSLHHRRYMTLSMYTLHSYVRLSTVFTHCCVQSGLSSTKLDHQSKSKNGSRQDPHLCPPYTVWIGLWEMRKVTIWVTAAVWKPATAQQSKRR